MTVSGRKISRKRAQEVVRAIVERHPRKKNAADTHPSGFVTCVYQKGRQHCLVGQALADLGLPMPKYNESFDSTDVAAEYFTPAAVRYLRDVQLLADVGVTDDEDVLGVQDGRVPWGRLPALAAEKGVRF